MITESYSLYRLVRYGVASMNTFLKEGYKMTVIKAKVIGFKIREGSDYKLYFATAGIIKNGTGCMCLQFSSRESLKVGEDVYVSYTTKQLPDGKVFKSWEFVKF